MLSSAHARDAGMTRPSKRQVHCGRHLATQALLSYFGQLIYKGASHINEQPQKNSDRKLVGACFAFRNIQKRAVFHTGSPKSNVAHIFFIFHRFAAKLFAIPNSTSIKANYDNYIERIVMYCLIFLCHAIGLCPVFPPIVFSPLTRPQPQTSVFTLLHRLAWCSCVTGLLKFDFCFALVSSVQLFMPADSGLWRLFIATVC